MRVALLVVVVALGSLAWPAGAAPGADAITAHPSAPLAAAPFTSAPPVRPILEATFDEALACRQACAQSYYFCAASAAADQCPSSWSQCAARCEAPGPPAPLATPEP